MMTIIVRSKIGSRSSFFSLFIGLPQRKTAGRSVNPVRNSSEALNPAGIILGLNPAAAAGPEGLWPGGRSGALFLTG
jgi:hypothetical protein